MFEFTLGIFICFFLVLECGLNGRLDTKHHQHHCVCNPGWIGTHCEISIYHQQSRYKWFLALFGKVNINICIFSLFCMANQISIRFKLNMFTRLMILLQLLDRGFVSLHRSSVELATWIYAYNIKWRDVQRKNVIHNIDLSCLGTPWPNGPYKNIHDFV